MTETDEIIHYASTLRQLAQEFIKAAAEIEAAARPDAFMLMHPADEGDVLIPAPAHLRRRAQALQQSRSRRAEFLDADLFSDAAWDILLELYVADHTGGVSDETVGRAARIAPSIAWRWVAILQERGLIARSASTGPAREKHVRLSPKGRRAISRYLALDLLQSLDMRTAEC